MAQPVWLTTLLVLVPTYIAYRWLARWNRERRFQAFAKANGCEPAADATPSWSDLFHSLNLLRKGGEVFASDDVQDGMNTISFKSNFGYSWNHFTLEPENVQAVLASKFDDWIIDKGPIFGAGMGHNIFTSEGEDWARARAAIRPHFNRENINNMEAMDQITSTFIKVLGEPDASAWTPPVKMQALLMHFTMSVAAEFLYGDSLGFLEAVLSGTGERARTAEQFRKDVERITKMVQLRGMLYPLYWLGDGPRHRLAVGRVRHVVEHFIKLALEAHKTGEYKSGLSRRLVEGTRDVQELRDQTIGLLFAGSDTTAAVLGWCFTRLALDPDRYEKMRNTILEEFPPGETIHHAKLKGCRELQNFISEVQRVHPIAPINVRKAVRNTVLPVGGGPDQKSPLAVRKGSPVAFSIYYIHRRKDRKYSHEFKSNLLANCFTVWGEDALEFRPDRWSERSPKAWSYLPFNGGEFKVLVLLEHGIEADDHRDSRSSHLHWSGIRAH